MSRSLLFRKLVISTPQIKQVFYLNRDDIILNFCKVKKLYKSRRNLLTFRTPYLS